MPIVRWKKIARIIYHRWKSKNQKFKNQIIIVMLIEEKSCSLTFHRKISSKTSKWIPFVYVRKPTCRCYTSIDWGWYFYCCCCCFRYWQYFPLTKMNEHICSQFVYTDMEQYKHRSGAEWCWESSSSVISGVYVCVYMCWMNICFIVVYFTDTFFVSFTISFASRGLCFLTYTTYILPFWYGG